MTCITSATILTDRQHPPEMMPNDGECGGSIQGDCAKPRVNILGGKHIGGPEGPEPALGSCCTAFPAGSSMA